MKKTVLLSVLILAIIGGSYAQGKGIGDGKNGGQDRKGPEKTTLSGVLGIKGGMIALENSGVTYYLVGLNRFVGFIDGLKAGAAVTLEGFAAPLPQAQQKIEGQFFRITKLTLAGKDYELAPAAGQGILGGNRVYPGMMQNQKNQWGDNRGNRYRNNCGPQGPEPRRGNGRR
ncbi:MAG: hypothetical protein LBN21_09390 [Treponema sp.]|jgi:hypothetical protein|nr:hypothetical protein [Treponema sp.]